MSWPFLLLTMVVCCATSVYADMLPGFDPPLEYKQLYGRMRKRTDTSRTAAGGIQATVDEYWMWMNAHKTIPHRAPTAEQKNLIKGLFGDFSHHLEHHRRKRQAGVHGPEPEHRIPVRKEIRQMSERELKIFFSAVNSLKRNTTVSPNVYEAIANYHTGITAVSAHGGCNFHGWHRLFSHIFEQALRNEGPEYAHVTVPYWDNRYETRMQRADPDSYMAMTRSALFSERLMGSCNGQAKGGIMTRDGWNSSIGPVVRNCGTDGPLIGDQMFRNVTSRKYMREICGEDSLIIHDLEDFHNGAHRFIDGLMALLSSSVHDPIFWLHHIFVDFIWEVFRQNSKRNGVDIEKDYPVNPTIMGAHALQIADADMGFREFSNVTVIDGLSEVFTSRFFRYAPPPTCTLKRRDCRSKYLKCVVFPAAGGRKRRAMCVARTLEEVIAWEEEQNKPKPEPCPKPTLPPTPRTTTPTPKPTLPPLPPIDPPKPKPRPKPIEPYQNTFCMNGKSDSGQWVYFPMKIIVRRPPQYKEYGSYPVKRGKIDKINGDIYSPSAYSNVMRHLRNSDHPATYDDCLEPDEPTNEIYIKSTGLNYEGRYKDYVIVDKRIAMSVSTGYMAVRKPTSDVDESIAMLHAQDRCGRVCKPICKVPGSQVFRPCSGAVRLTGKYPLMFGNSFGDAVLNVWDFDTEKTCPQLTTENIMISFYCDYKSDWIWPSEEPPPKQPPIIKTTPAPPITAGCIAGFRCVVNQPCRELVPCEEGKVYECVSACHAYGICARGRFFLNFCSRGQTYDHRTKTCAPGYCNMRTSGITNPLSRRKNRRRGRW